jgi:hypothetical protein
MIAMTQSYTDAYNTPKSPRLLQDAAGQWLGAAHYESELAQELVLVGYEEAAAVHASVAAECLANVAKLFQRGEVWAGESAKVFERYLSQASARQTHSLKLLKKPQAA